MNLKCQMDDKRHGVTEVAENRVIRRSENDSDQSSSGNGDIGSYYGGGGSYNTDPGLDYENLFDKQKNRLHWFVQFEMEENRKSYEVKKVLSAKRWKQVQSCSS